MFNICVYYVSCICDLLWYVARHVQSYSALHCPSWRSYAIYVLTYMTSGFEPITVLDIILQLWDIIPSVSFLRKPDRVKPSIKYPLQEKLTSWCDIPVISWYRSWQSHPCFFFFSAPDRRWNCSNCDRRSGWCINMWGFGLVHNTLLQEIEDVSWDKGIPGNPASLEKWLVRP